MKHILFLALAGMAVLLPKPAAGRSDYLLEVKEGDKIIHVDELRLPLSATLEDVIFLLPELLGRPGYSVLNNYDIEVEGFSIGESKDVVLCNIHASSIKEIKISESPANSYNNNGQGGTVKIVLKDPGKGASGNVDVTANTSLCAMPSAQVNYKNGKGDFSMHGFVMGEFFKTREDYVRYHLDATSPVNFSDYSDTTRKRDDVQLARAYMTYRPDERNKLDFLISGERIFYDTWKREKSSSPVSDRDVRYNVDAHVKYALSTDTKGSEFKVEAKFGYHPRNGYQDVPQFRSRKTIGNQGSWFGCIQYKPVFSDKLTMFFGADYNFSISGTDFNEESHYFGPQGPDAYSSRIGTYYVSPFAKALISVGQWSIKASFEYQLYDFAVAMTNRPDPFSHIRHDFTGSIFANWQFASNQNLRFSFERKINRPSVMQMTPDMSFDMSSYEYMYGNSSLNPMQIHKLEADYITDIRTQQGLFTLNAGVDYMFVDDIIRREKVTPEHIVGLSEYYTFNNEGRAGVLNGNLFLYYRSGMLTVSAAGNIFLNHAFGADNPVNYAYFNLSLQPTLTFPHDWIVSARAVWHGDVSTPTSYLCGFSYAYLHVAKTWNHFTVGLEGQLPFPKYVQDTTINGDGLKSYLNYRAVYAFAGLKLSYLF